MVTSKKVEAKPEMESELTKLEEKRVSALHELKSLSGQLEEARNILKEVKEIEKISHYFICFRTDKTDSWKVKGLYKSEEAAKSDLPPNAVESYISKIELPL